MNIDKLEKTIFLISLFAVISACRDNSEESSDWIELSYENCVAMENDTDHPYHKDEIAKAGCPTVIFDTETNATVK